MTLIEFLDKLKSNKPVGFDETMAVIAEHYEYQAAEFSNGLDDNELINKAGTNEGSCKIFAFAKMNGLDAQQTLNLFGDYYRLDVLNDPNGTGHQNIRNFMRYGWQGIQFKSMPLTLK
ncbi:HopJ type III effector protein [Methylotuvimicrobium sp. KM1]|uniref:HopJ type III effector protein n=1 Tax=Methylotuvimicrobium sp. KM1 TaxID=3377707 RepID=UPI003850145B